MTTKAPPSRTWWQRHVARSPSTGGMLAHNLATTLAVLALQQAVAPLSWRGTLLAFVVGACSWTAVEYVVHRWVFHAVLPLAHGKHHRWPTDSRYLHGPTHVVLGTWLSALAIYPLVAGRGAGLAAVAGLNFAYLVFELIHAVAHAPRCPRWLVAARRWHAQHHHVDEGRSFGFTSPVWDAWLGSWPPRSTVPRWLAWVVPVPVPLLHFGVVAVWKAARRQEIGALARR